MEEAPPKVSILEALYCHFCGAIQPLAGRLIDFERAASTMLAAQKDKKNVRKAPLQQRFAGGSAPLPIDFNGQGAL